MDRPKIIFYAVALADEWVTLAQDMLWRGERWKAAETVVCVSLNYKIRTEE